MSTNGDGEEQSNKTTTKRVTVAATAENVARISQYLDATRSELFFAKKLILVEGDSERLLLPSLFRRWKTQSLEKSGVTLVSAAGLNFHWFLPFIATDVLGIRVAIITDADPPKSTIGEEEIGESAYVTKLQSLVKDDPNLEVFFGKRTLEYDLALLPTNRDAILNAIENVRVRKGREFRKDSAGLKGEDFAEAFHRAFFSDKSSSKAVFAVELALQIEAGLTFETPPHLVDAFEHVLKTSVPPAIVR